MAWKLVAVSLAVGLLAFWWATAQDSGSEPVSGETVDCVRDATHVDPFANVDQCFTTPWYEQHPGWVGLGAGAAVFAIGGILISVAGVDRSRRARD